jgi:hypothetical protein
VPLREDLVFIEANSDNTQAQCRSVAASKVDIIFCGQMPANFVKQFKGEPEANDALISTKLYIQPHA